MEQKIELYGLVFGCPAGYRTNDCPFIGTDKLLLPEKIKWIAGLEEEEEEKLMQYHQACSTQR